MRNTMRTYLYRQNISIRELAKRCGISASTLSRFNRGVGDLTAHNARVLSEFLASGGKPEPGRKLFSREVEINGARFRLTLEELEGVR